MKMKNVAGFHSLDVTLLAPIVAEEPRRSGLGTRLVQNEGCVTLWTVAYVFGLTAVARDIRGGQVATLMP